MRISPHALSSDRTLCSSATVGTGTTGPFAGKGVGAFVAKTVGPNACSVPFAGVANVTDPDRARSDESSRSALELRETSRGFANSCGGSAEAGVTGLVVDDVDTSGELAPERRSSEGVRPGGTDGIVPARGREATRCACVNGALCGTASDGPADTGVDGSTPSSGIMTGERLGERYGRASPEPTPSAKGDGATIVSSAHTARARRVSVGGALAAGDAVSPRSRRDRADADQATRALGAPRARRTCTGQSTH